jgi:hypothetical protein
MFQFAKLDGPVFLLLGTDSYLSSYLCLLALGLVLLPCNLLFTFFHVLFCSIIGPRFTPWPLLVLTAPRSLSKRSQLPYPVLALLTMSFCSLRGNRMAQFGTLDDPIFLAGTSCLLLLVETFITTISFMISSIIKTSSMSLPSWVKVHR